MPEVPAARSPQPRAHGATSADDATALAKSLRRALAGYLQGRKLAHLKIRNADGNSIEGFLKIEGGKSERLLVDFKATLTALGGLSTLEVGGRKIAL